MLGSNEDGQLGLGDGIEKCTTPRELSAIKDKVTWAACGNKFTVVVTSKTVFIL